MDRRSRARRDAAIVATLLGGESQAETAKRFAVRERTVRGKLCQWRDGQIDLWRAPADLLDGAIVQLQSELRSIEREAVGADVAAKARLLNRYMKLSASCVKLGTALRRRIDPPGLPSEDFMEALNRRLRRLLGTRRVDRRTIEAVTEETMRCYDEFGGAERWQAISERRSAG